MSFVRHHVGPVLEAGDVAHAVIAAIRDRNPEVQVLDRGAYLRVTSPHRCRLDRHLVERVLGRAFRLPSDLELVMLAFSGSLRVNRDEAVWEATRR